MICLRCEIPHRDDLWSIDMICLIDMLWLIYIWYDFWIWLLIYVPNMYVGLRPWLWCCNYFEHIIGPKAVLWHWLDIWEVFILVNDVVVVHVYIDSYDFIIWIMVIKFIDSVHLWSLFIVNDMILGKIWFNYCLNMSRLLFVLVRC